MHDLKKYMSWKITWDYKVVPIAKAWPRLRSGCSKKLLVLKKSISIKEEAVLIKITDWDITVGVMHRKDVASETRAASRCSS